MNKIIDCKTCCVFWRFSFAAAFQVLEDCVRAFVLTLPWGGIESFTRGILRMKSFNREVTN
jgi:hypothetical protein